MSIRQDGVPKPGRGPGHAQERGQSAVAALIVAALLVGAGGAVAASLGMSTHRAMVGTKSVDLRDEVFSRARSHHSTPHDATPVRHRAQEAKEHIAPTSPPFDRVSLPRAPGL